MHVAINALAIDPRRPGGDGTYVRELVRNLVGLNDDSRYTLFVAPWSVPLFPAENDRLKHVICPVPARSFTVRALWEQATLPRLVRRAGVDVFHAPVNVCPLGITAPTVLTLLEAEPFQPNSGIPLPLLAYWRIFRSASARKARRVVAISGSSAREIATYMRVSPTKIKTVHLGVDTVRFRPPPHNQPRDRYVLWVGRSYLRKNLLGLLEGYARLPNTLRRNHPLVLLGVAGWADAQEQRAIERLKLRGDVHMVGRAADDDLPGWYQRARAFVFPSLHEAFGLPVLEALACATPVLASDIPALREIADDAAAFVNPRSVDDIARGLQRVLGDPTTLNRTAARGPALAAQFSWERAGRATRDVYAEAAT
ncbi:MAG: glycosyltransferase family 4 protein [Chloroflexi bacterium]|nr:glycosyltransferase family 4 protein [Chloroflexota bacterium]MBV9132962.1 glycosyltransferase family 4 protein [Chloroflexota bacterium]MBV9893477.1 glycosyltransferase family 4 protein [Chloroflexota bacterium]